MHAGHLPLASLNGVLVAAASTADLAPPLTSAAQLLVSPDGPNTVREASAEGTNGDIVERTACAECKDTIIVQPASTDVAPRGLARNP